MRSPIYRLYQTKLALLATLSSVAGVALLFVARWASAGNGWAWLAELPVSEIGATLFGTGLIVIAFEYVDREDAEERALLRLRSVLREEAPAFRDAVVDGFAFKPDALTNVASPETLDRIVRNCLAIRFEDSALASEAYADLREQVIQASERRYDVRASVALSPWKGGPASSRGAMFVATIRWEYRMVPSSSVLRFSCVSDLDEYDEVRQDPTSTGTWYFEPVGALNAGSEEAFQVLEAAVDGEPLRVRRTTRKGSQVYTATIGSDVMHERREVVISFAYRVLVQQNSHLLHLDISRPSKGLKVQFSYGGCGIRYVNVLDYIASARQPRVSQLAASEPTPSIDIGFDGWVFPKAGIAFVWVLETEMAEPSRDHQA
jgi:hypothetical protein